MMLSFKESWTLCMKRTKLLKDILEKGLKRRK
jgi:hypothetical protein